MRSSGSELSPPFQSKASSSLLRAKPCPQQAPAAVTNPSEGWSCLGQLYLCQLLLPRAWGGGKAAVLGSPQHSASLPACHSILVPQATQQPPDARIGKYRWLRGNSAAASAHLWISQPPSNEMDFQWRQLNTAHDVKNQITWPQVLFHFLGYYLLLLIPGQAAPGYYWGATGWLH